jgi:hypothetical protein
MLARLYRYLLKITGVGCIALLAVIAIVVVLLILLFLLPEGAYISAMIEEPNGQWIAPTAHGFAEHFASIGRVLFIVAPAFVIGLVLRKRRFDDEASFWSKLIAVVAVLFVGAGCVIANWHYGGYGVNTMLVSLSGVAVYLTQVFVLGGLACWIGWEGAARSERDG